MVAFRDCNRGLACWLLLLVLAHITIACPFFRRNVQTNATMTRRLATTSEGSSMCEKTGFKAIVPKKKGICKAYRKMKRQLNGILTTQVQPNWSIFGSAIRLAFHDAGEIDVRLESDKLGPDGCLSSDERSAGLVEPDSIVQLYLEPMYQAVCNKISRGDFIALLGKIVIELATSGAVTVPFHYGRVDTLNCEGGVGRLPDPEGGLEELRRVLVRQMGLTIDEAVTLLGAHSLGHTHIDASGIGFRADQVTTNDPNLLNARDATPGVLDNDYFVKLFIWEWTARFTEAMDGQQWQRETEPFAMINTDIALFYPLSITFPPAELSPEGEPLQVCGSGQTQPQCVHPTNTTTPSTWALAKSYAQNNLLFQRAFAEAYTRMVTVGYSIDGTVSGDGTGCDGVPGWNDGNGGVPCRSGKLGTLTSIDLDSC